MPNHRPDQDTLTAQLKQLIADQFRLDIREPATISDQAPIIGGTLGLDSLDGLELAMSVEEEFGIVIGTREESQQAFASIASLADYIRARTHPGHRGLPDSAAA